MTPPIAKTLKLDERKLPAQVFDRLAERGGYIMRDRKAREENSEKAWENFGKPGRDPSSLDSVLGVIAGAGNWTPQLKMAQLRDHWDQVVGPGIAQHSTVADLRDGVLVIRTESPNWATTLTYMIPQLTATIRERLAGLDIREIRVSGPMARRGGGYRGYRRRY
ncbi:DUF721 domain-containing protein [Bifidobacterium biavatii]|uniref:Zn-ribbon-containing RNA-binding protein n=1 Tax=Bifidobacterium biavatii DSM 23969 TaxID=1437608 RepID=A0A086ZSN3_9BIFI|nr:DUF721 domain-containing protein [Bifidobacterium biavatii]KFI49533.1 zn-ribbon-containing RNA-binding protein [Bifidobacterium biavatii DSM 23969]